MLGAGVLVFGLRPRLSAVAAYGIVVWSFLVDLLGSLVKGSDWLRDSSLFSHMALAPAAKPDWGTAAIVVLLALVVRSILNASGIMLPPPPGATHGMPINVKFYPLAYGAGLLAMVLTMAIASYFPARRAARVRIVDALTHV